MDISEFIEVAKNLNVLGIKITKDGELAAEWPYPSDNSDGYHYAGDGWL